MKHVSPSSQAGHAALETVLVLALLAIVFIPGADSPIRQLINAIASHHQRFTWAISLP